MATATELLELIFSWIEQREHCAEKLKKLSRELDSIREACTSHQCICRFVSVAGAGVYTGVGLPVSLPPKLTDHLRSSVTMKEAQNIQKWSNNIREKIQRLFEILKAESSSTDLDEQDQHVMTEIVKAVARRSGLRLRSTSEHLEMFLRGHMGASALSLVMTAVASILICLSYQAEGKTSKLLFDKGAEQLLKKGLSPGFESFIKRVGLMIMEGAVGMVFALSEATDNWEEMIEKNHVTEASQSLRDTADAILEMTWTLKEQLDNINSSYRNAVERFARVQRAVANSNRSFNDKKEIIDYVIENSEDETVKQWLRENSESEAFFHLVDMFYYLKPPIEEEKKKKKKKNLTIDIIFVAHGAIEHSMTPTSILLPLPSITDVILYSPWNCVITADVAYGVATGHMKPQHRVFCCANEYCCVPDEEHRPTNLPNDWNSMKKAGNQKIPNITLSSLNPPKDGAWERFLFLQDRHGRPGRNRIVIPLILPEGIRSSVRVPFVAVMMPLSVVLSVLDIKATVHLTACLGKGSARTNLNEEYLQWQYACTIDHTGMNSSLQLDVEHPDLYEALKAVFG